MKTEFRRVLAALVYLAVYSSGCSVTKSGAEPAKSTVLEAESAAALLMEVRSTDRRQGTGHEIESGTRIDADGSIVYFVKRPHESEAVVPIGQLNPRVASRMASELASVTPAPSRLYHSTMAHAYGFQKLLMGGDCAQQTSVEQVAIGRQDGTIVVLSNNLGCSLTAVPEYIGLAVRIHDLLGHLGLIPMIKTFQASTSLGANNRVVARLRNAQGVSISLNSDGTVMYGQDNVYTLERRFAATITQATVEAPASIDLDCFRRQLGGCQSQDDFEWEWGFLRLNGDFVPMRRDTVCYRCRPPSGGTRVLSILRDIDSVLMGGAELAIFRVGALSSSEADDFD